MVGYGLDGAVAFVTGGATGIGRATAELLGAEGANVVVADVNDDDAAHTIKTIEAAGGTGLVIHTDVSDPEAVAAAIGETVSSFGRLDAAVNCAAITLGAERLRTAQVAIETFDRLLSVDLRGVFLCMKYELLQMVEQGSGSIVNIASSAGVVGTPLNVSYVAAKHGVIGLTRAAAIDHAADGVRINVLCPGLTDTGMIAERPPGYRERIEAAIPMGRTATPEEIANAIVWLCSPRSTYATGAVFNVDGGFTGTR